MPAQSGAIFKLVKGDDRVDDKLRQTKLLAFMIAKYRREREAQGKKNPLPTIADLSRTHLNPFVRSYRPFIANASEYARVTPKGPTHLYRGSESEATFTIPNFGHFTSDMVLRVRISPVGTSAPVVAEGAGPFADDDYSDRLRFCAYPGIRLVTEAGFESGGVEVDRYTRDDVLFYDKFRVGADRRTAWDRAHGHGEVREGTYFNNNGFSGVLNYREGLQSYKFRHDPADMWVPLHFDWCNSPESALPNDMIPNGDRTVKIKLARLEEMVQAIGQITGTVRDLPFERLGISLELYVNQIYVNAEVHDLYASRLVRTLIRVHRSQTINVQQPNGEFELNQLKFPTEYIMLGFRDKRNADDFDHWHLFGRAPERAEENALIVTTSIYKEPGKAEIVTRFVKEASTLEPLAESVLLTAGSDIKMTPDLPVTFFSTYLPQRYPDDHLIVSPVDSSAMLIPFCLTPGVPQPTGYFNLSTIRDLNFVYLASRVSGAEPAEIVASASALNFLVRNGDRVELAYSN
jgi:hypothetical protein